MLLFLIISPVPLNYKSEGWNATKKGEKGF